MNYSLITKVRQCKLFTDMGRQYEYFTVKVRQCSFLADKVHVRQCEFCTDRLRQCELFTDNQGKAM